MSSSTAASEPAIDPMLRDDLSNLELRVARRADELAQHHRGRGPTTDREFWRQAERDVLGRELDHLTAA